MIFLKSFNYGGKFVGIRTIDTISTIHINNKLVYENRAVLDPKQLTSLAKKLIDKEKVA